ncbi:MAG TPA: thermonuclease family protein [Rhizobiaceae bacterium]|nr:thermonuclease family protein [Rhizobiaceae bacterium]
MLANLILVMTVLLAAAIFFVPAKKERERSTTRATDPATFEEPVRGDLRHVTPQDMTQPPPIPEGTLVRIPAVEPPPAPPRPPRPVSYSLPRITAAGAIVSGDKQIRLSGIDPLAADARCTDATGEWPCGAFAKVAFQRLVRQRTIECDPVEPGDGLQIATSCRVGGVDMAQWLVSQGWARPVGADFDKALAEAKASARGQWGPRPQSGSQ